MTEIRKETVTQQGSNVNPVVSSQTKSVAVKSKVSSTQTISYLIYYIFGALEILLAFRLVLKLLGASMASPFVNMVYGLSRLFIMPFEGIFRRAVTQGIETTSVLEPSTIVAMIVYALLAWGIVKLTQISSGEQPTE